MSKAGAIDAHKGLRQFIAGIVRGEIKRSANRIPKMATERRQYVIAQLAARAGVEETMKQFAVDRRTVQRAVQAYKRALERNPSPIIEHYLFQVCVVFGRKRQRDIY
jgi:hypothetical protein